MFTFNKPACAWSRQFFEDDEENAQQQTRVRVEPSTL
jgi:hypothetical protein